MEIKFNVIGALRAVVLGGPEVVIGQRIAPPPAYLVSGAPTIVETSSVIGNESVDNVDIEKALNVIDAPTTTTTDIPTPDSPGESDAGISDEERSTDTIFAFLDRQKQEEQGHAIQYRSCSWQKTAALIFSEFICLAIMNFPWSYSVLGLVPGLLLTFAMFVVFIYTSLVLWQFSLRHPEIRDVCDVGRFLLWGSDVGWWLTAIMFLLNNTFIQGLHILVGSKYLNTMAPDAQISCSTVAFAVITTLMCWLCSLPRTFSVLSRLAVVSAVSTAISLLLATLFAGVQDRPRGYTLVPPSDGDGSAFGEPVVSAWMPASTTYVTAVSAFLNIAYTFVGQIALPSFIAEMREPRDFPKALWLVGTLMTLVFGAVGAVVYAFIGAQYMTNPAFGSLGDVYKKVSFSFMVPTIIFVGVLYASLSCRFVFFRIFKNTRHMNDHTVLGWAAWAGLLLASWVLAFVIAQVVPFFDSLLSIMASLFDSFFGFIFWAVAYFRMHRADTKRGIGTSSASASAPIPWASHAANVIIFAIGVFFLTGGLYATVESVMANFADVVGAPFACASNALA